jgi:sugar phosphate isomerase/epimerase
MHCWRRRFLAAAFAGACGAARAAPTERRTIRLGYDNFAVRAMQWDARQLVDHAVKLGCQSVFITDFGPFRGATDDDALGQIRGYAADRGIHLGIRMAKALGSPAFRVILGNQSDRLTDGGIEARIADTLAVLKRARSRAVDAGVKIAVENHAGDMQSHELRRLVEEAGPEFVGVNFDSGNACWTLEDPVRALRTLAP